LSLEGLYVGPMVLSGENWRKATDKNPAPPTCQATIPRFFSESTTTIRKAHATSR
jgi:hypothetical protein